MPIEPAIREWLTADQAARPEPVEGDAAARRVRNAAAYNASMERLHGAESPDDGVTVQLLSIPTPTGAVPARVFVPRDAKSLPAYLFFFGGGWWQTTFDSPGVIAGLRQTARNARIVVVQLQYSLAPEHPHPTALEEGWAALRWLTAGRSGLPVDPARVAVGGSSGGANLAAALCLVARDRGGPAIALQVLEVPGLDLTRRNVDLSVLGEPGLDEDPLTYLPGLHESVRFYLGDRDPATPYASPLRAASFAGLPPALILTAQFDPLRPDGVLYGDSLAAAGVPVVSVTYASQVHESGSLGPLSPAARAWRAQVDWALSTIADAPFASAKSSPNRGR
jgi:acetyl esterase